MRKTLFILIIASLSLLASPWYKAGPGCSGPGCHFYQAGIMEVSIFSEGLVQVYLPGYVGQKVAGELVRSDGLYLEEMDDTLDNPFYLHAPTIGTYTVNAGPRWPYESKVIVIDWTAVETATIGALRAMYR